MERDKIIVNKGNINILAAVTATDNIKTDTLYDFICQAIKPK